MTHCSAQQSCPAPFGGSDTPVSCTGHTSCLVGSYYVTCDGVTTYCGCWGPIYDPECHCQCYESGGSGRDCLRECSP